MKLKVYEYTKDEKIFIKNKVKNYKRLFDRLKETSDYLTELAYVEWHREELSPLAKRVEGQVEGMSFMITHFERCFEVQTLSVWEYDEQFQADKKMVKQIQKYIEYINNKPTIEFRYR